MALVIEIEKLRDRAGDLDTAELDQLNRLEELLRPTKGERSSLRNLTEQQSVEVWETPHYTGDPLTDYWEYRITRDLFHPEELDLKEPPRRELWNEPWSMIRPEVELIPVRRGRRSMIPVRRGRRSSSAKES